jgi:hypothetical protein
MDIDHLFVFTDQPQRAAERLQAAGLREGTANTHPGQGTACRRFFFRNAYLELVWVSRETEVRSPAIARARFWERSRSTQSGYSPFGICLRNAPSGECDPLEAAWQYAPSFVPAGQYARIASNEAYPAEPLLFDFPFHQLQPLEYPPERQQPLVHPNGFREVTGVKLTLPKPGILSDGLQKVIRHGCLQLVKGPHYHVDLEFDYGAKGAVESFKDTLPMSFRW